MKNILLDLKVSVNKSMRISWVRQLLLYYALEFYNHVNDEKVTQLMIYNARIDTIFYVDIADIDKSVFEFGYKAAEKQSVINEMKTKKLMRVTNSFLLWEYSFDKSLVISRVDKLKY